MGVFRFKRFSIDDSRCGMKIGTDGVLLGAWARVDDSCGHVIDVGTGSGLVALMMAQRYSGVKVTGVDVDPDACLDACDNAKASPWASRVSIVNADVRQWTPVSVDVRDASVCIVSNPPFFTEQLRSPDTTRALARHGEGFDVEALIAWSAGVIFRDGDSLSFIAPAGRDDAIQYCLSLHRLTPARITDVVPKAGKAPLRRLYEVRPDRWVAGPCEMSMLCLRDNSGAFTDEYNRLTDQFYLDRT
ncbi:MAG: methyltransferase [Paenibacillus sp.]|nr:methyltransferase [Paenibacillus sp.]